MEARSPEAGLIDIPSRKVRALLAYLALPPGRGHERDALATLLWGDTSDENSRHSLRQALSVLRRGLPGTLLLDERVALDPAAVECDAADFERLARAGDPASLEAAARLWTGDLLEGFHVGPEPFEEWLRTERTRLHDVAVDAFGKLLGLRVRSGADAEAIQLSHRVLALDPSLEPVHRTVMRLYAGAGRRGAALHHYQRLVATLRSEYGTTPEPETVELHSRLLRRAAPVASTALPADAPEPLIGRETELATVAATIERALSGQGGCLAILGEAGAGKSRLLEEVEGRWLARGGRVLLGRAHRIERALPLAAWAEALRSGLTHEETVGVWPSQLARLLPEVSSPEPTSDVGGQGRAALVDAVIRLIARLAGECPVLIALEDLHWADAGSLDLLGHVARRFGPGRVLAAFTARDEELPDAPGVEALVRELGRERRLDRLSLGALSRDAVEAIVRSRLGASLAASDVARIADTAWTTSQGNALFVVETVRAAQDGRLARTGGRPGLVKEILAERLGRVSPGARRLSELAAVIGRRSARGLCHSRRSR
jgi:DNA-binding SARP family transcriptional activator